MTEMDEQECDPVHEKSMFMDWILTCFRWENLAPSKEELKTISEAWYPGQAPADAVSKAIRERQK